MRIAVHVDASTVRTIMAVKIPLVLSSRLANNCLVCQTGGSEAPGAGVNVLTAKVGAI